MINSHKLFSRMRLGITSLALVWTFFPIAHSSSTEYFVTTLDGNGADAYTSSNDATNPLGANDPGVMKIRRGNAKAYLRFDLGTLDLTGLGVESLAKDDVAITEVTLTLHQIDPLRTKPLDLYAINLNRDWEADGRLGNDWIETELTHLNAPASGAGGSFSTSDGRSAVLGTFIQSGDFRYHTYTETVEDSITPLLDYLNGLSSLGSQEVWIRNLGIRESDAGANNTDNFVTKETTLPGVQVPTLRLVVTKEEDSSEGPANPFRPSITTADGNGANAWTNANTGDPQGSFVHSADDPTEMKIRRGNAKAYLRFDLGALDLGSLGISSLLAEPDLAIVAAEIAVYQLGPLREKSLDLHAINLNRDWPSEGRLGVDWDQNELTHLNAPASGSGGSISVSDNRSILIGTLAQSQDYRTHTYSESVENANTPLLDYLNGVGLASNRETLSRVLGLVETPGGANNTDNFATRDTDLPGAEPPTLTLTLAPRKHSYLDWIVGFDLPEGESDREANPSGDGISNALKYALDLDPRENSRQDLPVPELVTVDGRDYLSLSISRNENALAGLLVETSDDLKTWEADPDAMTLVEATATGLRMRDTVPVTEADRRFMRLRVLFDVYNRYTDKVVTHLNTLLEHGRDRYGPVHTPLFMAVLDDETLTAPSDPQYAPFPRQGHPPDHRALGGANLWKQSDLIRLLHNMAPYNPDFAPAADDHLLYYIDNLSVFDEQGQEGMLWWGNHLYYDAFTDEPVTESRLHHEINMGFNDPMFLWERMWNLRPNATLSQIEQIWEWAVFDKEEGKWDRHATNDHYWAVGFSAAGASYIRAFALAYQQTGNPVWRDRAEKLRDFMWSRRDPVTNLIPNASYGSEVRGGETFWRRNFASSREPGYWVPALLYAYKIFNDSNWKAQAEAIMTGYLTYAFDPQEQRFYRWIRIDGVYDPDYVDGAGNDYGGGPEAGYSIFWRDFSNFRNNSYIALAALDAYEAIGDPFYLQGVEIIGQELLVTEPRSDSQSGGNSAGAWAEHYGSAIDILARLHRHTGNQEYLDRAVYIADHAVQFLWNGETGIFRGHSAHGYEVTDGTDKLCEKLVMLDRYLLAR